MTTAMALLVGYVFGWMSVLVAYHVLRPAAAQPLPEEESEPAMPEKTPEQIAADQQFQQWLAQMDDMLKYDGKGGVKDGDKD